jgi:hypothetical protein
VYRLHVRSWQLILYHCNYVNHLDKTRGLKNHEYQMAPLVYLLMRCLEIGHIVWVVTLQFVVFDTHRSSALFRVNFRIVIVTKFTAVLHVGSMVYYHSFLFLSFL